MIKQYDLGEEEIKNNNSVSKKVGLKSGNHSIKHSNENSHNSRTIGENTNDEEQFSLKKKFDPIGKSFGLMSKLDDQGLVESPARYQTDEIKVLEGDMYKLEAGSGSDNNQFELMDKVKSLR